VEQEGFMSIQNIRRSVLIVVGVAALAVGGLFAGRLFAHQMDHGSGSGSGPKHMFARISRQLSLTEAQQAQIRVVLKSHADEIEAQAQSGTAARRALHDAVLSASADEATIRSLAAQVGAAQGDASVLYAKIRAEVWPILTSDQQKSFATFHSQMRQRTDDSAKALDQWLRGTN
jgi:periplasmic protein CpxP/Spy